MIIFFQLLGKITPLYLLIALGFISGKYLKIKKEVFATILIYIISPIVFFNGAYISNLTPGSFSLPFLYFILASAICLSFLLISKLIWKDSLTRNIFAFVSGASNTGYFGLPVAVTLFGDKVAGNAVLIILGSAFFESIVGYFIAARGQHSVKGSLLKIFKIPPVYALILGILFNSINFQLDKIYFDSVSHFKNAYTIFGMMLIGLAIADIKKWKFDIKFVSLSLFSKFIVWPLLMSLVIFLDSKLLHLYGREIHQLLLLMSIVPVAANSVIYATLLKAHPEKVSVAVLTSTIFALFYVPLGTALLIK